MTELTHFCVELVAIINLDESSDVKDSLAKLRKLRESNTPGMSVVVVGTAGKHVEILKGGSIGACYSIILDKVDCLQAYGFKSELEEIANSLKLSEASLDGKVVMTTSVHDDKA